MNKLNFVYLKNIAKNYLGEKFVEIKINSHTAQHVDIEQKFIKVSERDKINHLIKELSEKDDQTVLVFVNTKYKAEDLMNALLDQNFEPRSTTDISLIQ